MRLFVNGHPVQSNPPHTIRGVLTQVGVEPSLTVVEHNGTALLRSEWEARVLAPDDRLELVRIAAGG